MYGFSVMANCSSETFCVLTPTCSHVTHSLSLHEKYTATIQRHTNHRLPTQITCGNFIDLANDGFYDGIHIHRVIPRLLIQLGCPYARGDTASALCGTGAPPHYSQFRATDGRMMQRNGDGGIPDEMGDENAMVTDMGVSTDDYSSNVSQDPERHKISNLAGTLSMANTGQPDSGGSQFFINVGGECGP